MVKMTPKKVVAAILDFAHAAFSDGIKGYDLDPERPIPEGVVLRVFRPGMPFTAQEARSFSEDERQGIVTLLMRAVRIYGRNPRTRFPADLLQSTGSEHLGPRLLADLAQRLPLPRDRYP